MNLSGCLDLGANSNVVEFQGSKLHFRGKSVLDAMKEALPLLELVAVCSFQIADDKVLGDMLGLSPDGDSRGTLCRQTPVIAQPRC